MGLWCLWARVVDTIARCTLRYWFVKATGVVLIVRGLFSSTVQVPLTVGLWLGLPGPPCRVASACFP